MLVVFSLLVPLVERTYLQQKRDLCQRLVEAAVSNLESRETEVREGLLPLEEAQARAVSRLRTQRFGEEGKDYFWITGPDDRFIMHPYRPDLEGRDTRLEIGPDGQPLKVLLDKMNLAAGPDGDGFLEYQWHWKDDLSRLVDKVSYVDRFETWGWMVGTGVYVDDVESELASMRRQTILAGLVLTALASGLAFLLSVRSVRAQRSEVMAHERLAASEENLRITLKSIGDAVIATDIHGCVQQMNSVAEDIIGYSLAEVRGRSLSTIFRIIDDTSQQAIPSPVDEVLTTGEVVTLSSNTVLISRDGQRRRIADSGAPIRDREGRVVGVVLVFRDITDEHTLQERLRQVQKMEVVGQLAGGVAHDFNNMLAAIMGCAELLNEDLPADSEQRPLLSTILGASRHAADLTAKLLTFSRKGKVMSTALDIHEPIREAMSLLRRSLDRKIRLTTRFEATSDKVIGDPTLLQNAVMNLALNARDAMPDGGSLTVATRNVNLEDPSLFDLMPELEPGRYVEVSVSDTGAGISIEDRDKVLEPFYTTKPVGQGTGLGLSTVYGTVKDHNGAIGIDSTPGQGTTVVLLLPQDSDALALTDDPTPKVVRGHGQLLLVDDEELVRSMARAQLRSLGYDVLLARDGQEALEIFERDGESIDAVVLDMVMPRMDGRQAFQRLRRLDPSIRILFSSGFDPEGSLKELTLGEGVGFVAKPYSQATLSQAVAALLAD